MAFNPQEFISDINSTNGVALSSDFRVRITPPDIMIDEGLARNLEFRIDSIEFPGRNVNEINYSLCHSFRQRRKMVNVKGKLTNATNK